MKTKLFPIAALALSCIISIIPCSLTVQADNGKSLQNPSNLISGYSEEKGDTGYDYLYLGENSSNSSVKWRVLSARGNAIGSDDRLADASNNSVINENAFFILTEDIIATRDDNPNQADSFQNSVLKNWCSSIIEGNNEALLLSKEEVSSLLKTRKDDATVDVYPSGNLLSVTAELFDDQVFFLSGAEALNAEYGFSSDCSATDSNRVAKYNGKARLWILRQPKEDILGASSTSNVTSKGRVTTTTFNNGNILGMRPAANLSKDAILFASAAESEKSDFSAIAENTTHEWKLTLKDDNDFSSGAKISSQKAAPGDQLTISHRSLSEISSDYTNVTAALYDQAGTMLYYGSINNDPSSTASTLTLDSTLENGTYTLQIYGEDWNDVKCTDYATGTPFETDLIVDSSITAANVVATAIEALPEAEAITLADKDTVEAARAAYDQLSDAEKEYVDAEILKHLTDAEAKINELQTSKETPSSSESNNIGSNTNNAANAGNSKSPTSKAKTVKKGDSANAGNLNYKVTSVTASSRAVTVTGMKNKKKTSVTIPSTIKIDNVSYKVTAISGSAFKSCVKLKKITIGKNIQKIGKNAFKSCKKLKTITIKSRSLKSVGASALKGINKKAVIKVPSAKLKAYKKLLKGKGQAKTVTIKK